MGEEAYSSPITTSTRQSFLWFNALKNHVLNHKLVNL